MKKLIFFILLFLPLILIFGGILGWIISDNEIFFIVFTLFLTPLNIVALYIYFGIITKQYPLNDLSNYNIDIRQDIPLNIDNGTLLIKIMEAKKGVWIFQSNSDIRVFNLKGYMFPKFLIAAFFFRAYNYVEINKKKLKWNSLGKSIYLSYLREYQSVHLKFISAHGKEKDLFIVKDNKTINKFAISEIIWINYFDDLINRRWGAAKKFGKYKKLSEKEFQQSNKKNKPSISQEDWEAYRNFMETQK